MASIDMYILYICVCLCVYIWQRELPPPHCPLCKGYNGTLWTLSPEATLIPSVLILCPQMNQDLWLHYPILHKRFHYDHKRHINIYLRGHHIHLKAMSFITCRRRVLVSGLSPVKHRSVSE